MSETPSTPSDALPIDVLYEELSSRAARTGDVVTATVGALEGETVTVTAGTLQGVIPLAEFQTAPEAGAEIQAYVDTVDGEQITFSVHKAERVALWARLERARDEGETLQATILSQGRGNYVVDLLGVKAVLPQREVGARRGRDGESLLGTSLPVRITRIREKKALISVSERATQATHYKAVSESSLSSLEAGQIVDGVVQRVTHFGAFVDIGGIDGLLHVKDMSWQRLRHPEDMVDEGDHLRVKVLRIDDENDKIALGLKHLAPDPWAVAQEFYVPGAMVQGEVVGLTDFGAFVMLEDGLEGLVHASELSWTQRGAKPADLVRQGQRVTAWVLRCDRERKRLGLTLKNPADNPWQSIKDSFPAGTRLRAKVARVVEFGIFVELAPGFDGLVHISDFAWGTLNQSPAEFFVAGQEVDVMMLDVDAERGRANLGIKQLTEDTTPSLDEAYAVDQELIGEVTSLQSYGAFVRIGPGVEGLIHISAMGQRVSSPDAVVKVGQEVNVRIVSVDAVADRIGLALVNYGRDAEDASAEDAPAEDVPVAETSTDEEPSAETPSTDD
jgi:small subunit ribosomal protein S1